MARIGVSVAGPDTTAASITSGEKAITAPSRARTPTRRARSAARIGPENGTSATASPSASAMMAASTPLASGSASPSPWRSSTHPARCTAAARRSLRVRSARSATVRGPSSRASRRAVRRSSACSGVSRVSIGRELYLPQARVTLQKADFVLSSTTAVPCPTGSPMLREHHYHPLTVADVIDETADTRSFVLGIPPALEVSFAYAAGQYCTFRATIGGEPIVRCYSMSSSPETGDPFTVTVKRVSGGKMSNWLNDTLAAGDMIEAMPPAGLFVLRAGETPIVAFAGGSGITPILSIIKTALTTTAREIALVYANRDPGSVIFGDAIERLRAGSGGRLTVHHHLDSEQGFLDAAACAALVGDRTTADFFVCGPAPYMQVVQAGLERRGVDAGQLFIERFDLPDDAPSRADSETESITIRLEGRKRRARYERGDTILDAARRLGLSPPFSCQAGNCATCMAYLEEGTVAMRVNNALGADEVEQGWILTCQAIPTSREVVVDYDR